MGMEDDLWLEETAGAGWLHGCQKLSGGRTMAAGSLEFVCLSLGKEKMRRNCNM